MERDPVAALRAEVKRLHQELGALRQGQGLRDDASKIGTRERTIRAILASLAAPELLERLSDLEHERWSGWETYRAQTAGLKHPSGEPYEARWKRLREMGYGSLSERDKESDRIEARRTLVIIQEAVREAVDAMRVRRSPEQEALINIDDVQGMLDRCFAAYEARLVERDQALADLDEERTLCAQSIVRESTLVHRLWEIADRIRDADDDPAAFLQIIRQMAITAANDQPNATPLTDIVRAAMIESAEELVADQDTRTGYTVDMSPLIRARAARRAAVERLDPAIAELFARNNETT